MSRFAHRPERSARAGAKIPALRTPGNVMKRFMAAASTIGAVIALVVALALKSPAPAAAIQQSAAPELSLMTETPQEGFDLALRLSRMAVVATQPDREVLQGLRPDYSHDATSLIGVSHVVA